MSKEVFFLLRRIVFTPQALYQFQYVKNSDPGNEAVGNILQTNERSLSYFDENPAAGREAQPSSSVTAVPNGRTAGFKTPSATINEKTGLVSKKKRMLLRVLLLQPHVTLLGMFLLSISFPWFLVLHLWTLSITEKTAASCQPLYLPYFTIHT